MPAALPPPHWPHGVYRTILADPPWSYSVWGGQKATGPVRHGQARTAASHYPTMSLAEIAALPVASLADPRGCALFLWVTPPCMAEGLATMAAWGFTYKTVAFTWIKTTKGGHPAWGLGHYTRANAELCLLGIRGRRVERRAKDVHSVIQSPRREHSRKPDEQYPRIMRLLDGPYLELFSRTSWPGWDCWGRDVGRFDTPARPVPLPLLAASA